MLNAPVGNIYMSAGPLFYEDDSRGCKPLLNQDVTREFSPGKGPPGTPPHRVGHPFRSRKSILHGWRAIDSCSQISGYISALFARHKSLFATRAELQYKCLRFKDCLLFYDVSR